MIKKILQISTRLRSFKFMMAMVKENYICTAGRLSKPITLMSQIPSLQEFLWAKLIYYEDIRKLELPTNRGEKLDLNSEQILTLVASEVVLCDTNFLIQYMDLMPNLKWAHCTWAGVEDLLAAVKSMKAVPSFTVTRHAGSSFTLLMAEYVLCQILNWERKMPLLWKNQEKSDWASSSLPTYNGLSELVVGILGVGNMGCGIARALKCLGCKKVKGFSRSPKSTDEEEYSWFDVISTSLNDVLEDCEYLCNVLPSTDQTKGLLNDDVLSNCHERPVFINVGRGNIIDEACLIKALKNLWISGAVLDVFEEEPLPKSSELWNMSSVVITPHIAAMSKPEHVANEFVRNFELYNKGQPLLHQVNWEHGY